MNDIKRCSKCGIISSKTNFYKDRTKKDGVRSECISCFEEYFYDNRDRLLNSHKSYNKKNYSKINDY